MENEKKTEEFVLIIELSDTSSELMMRLEKILLDDLTSHKLPNEKENS